MTEQHWEGSLRNLNLFCGAWNPEIITGSFDYINRSVAFTFLNIYKSNDEQIDSAFSHVILQIRNRFLRNRFLREM